MGFIDADGHVMECDETWDYLDPAERVHKPRLLQFADSEKPGLEPPFHWIVGDTWARRPPRDGNVYNNGNAYAPGCLDLTDPAKRIEDLDALGIDVQVIHSTFFIGVELDNADVEAAITRSYNRWIADRLHGYTDRLRWTVRPPVRNIPRALEELEFGKEHGAVGVALRGIEHDMYLSDRSLWPIYEKAQDLDLPIIIHLGASVRKHHVPVGRLVPAPAALTDHVYPLMSGFHAVIASDFHQRFPRLRFGFVEGGATWVLAVIQFHARVAGSQGFGDDGFMRIHYMTPEELEARNVFVACESDEDIAYIANLVGENVLCTGTDYGHNDAGGELGVHERMLKRTDISQVLAEKIVDTNGRKLYGIDPAFRPAPPLGSGGELAVKGAQFAGQEPYRFNVLV